MKELKVFYGEYKKACESEGGYYVSTVEDSYDAETKTIIVSVDENIAKKFEKGYYKNEVDTEFGRLSVVVSGYSIEALKNSLDNYKKLSEEERNSCRQSINGGNGNCLREAIRYHKYDRLALLLDTDVDLDILNEVDVNEKTLIGRILKDYEDCLTCPNTKINKEDIEKVLDMIKEKDFIIDSENKEVKKAEKTKNQVKDMIKRVKEETAKDDTIENITDEELEEIEKEEDIEILSSKVCDLESKKGLAEVKFYKMAKKRVLKMEKLYPVIEKLLK